MALRFRKSVKIAPGLKVNFSTRGMSTTVGRRGASVNIGSRSVHGNVGIPGTGLTYRTRLDGGGGPTRASGSTRSSRSEYRELERQAGQARKVAERVEVQRHHQAHQARLDALGSVLKNRERGEFDMQGFAAPRDFEPVAHRSVSHVRATIGLWFLLAVDVIVGLAFVSIGVAEKSPIGVAIVLAAMGGIGWAVVRETKKRKAVIEQERVDHEAAEAERKSAWEQFEAVRARFRNDPTPEDLTQLLEIELANEDLPVPLVFELAYDDADRVEIELLLPEFEDVPETKTSVTKTGKLSEKKMAQTDRVALYSALCCGIALRLVHETFSRSITGG